MVVRGANQAYSIMEEGTACTTEELQGIDLNDDELSEFTKLFNTNEYKVFLHEAFDNPEQIYWDYLTSYTCIAKEEKYSDELNAEYLKAYDEQFGYKEDELRWPLYSLKKSDISDFIKRHSGLHKTPDLNFYGWTYIEKYDSYFEDGLWTDNMIYKCVSGEKTDDRYTLRFQAKDESSRVYPERLLTMTKTDDDYVMVSNKILEDCYYDRQTFEFEINQNEAPVKIDAIYYAGDWHRNAYETSFVLAENNASMAEIDYKAKILDTDLYDYNADNTKDIAFIVESDAGKQVLMFDGHFNVNEYGYIESSDDYLQVKLAEKIIGVM